MDTIHGYPVIASVLTGRVDNSTNPPKEARIVLVKTREASLVPGERYITDEYVTGFHWVGDAEWNNGHYFTNFKEALRDFWERVSNEVGLTVESVSCSCGAKHSIYCPMRYAAD